MALENIRQRLELAWPGRARVETEQTEDEFCARLIFPYASDEAPADNR
jgi:two-component system sensor histidine kinase AlgZ